MINSQRLYLIDIARAFAAICVVLQHYQHFYFVEPHQYVENFARNQQPFYNLLEPAYKFGSVAVQFFFVISGFIFFMYYREKILQKSVSFRDFIILRISRLYPLHLLTLLFMLFIQNIHLYFSSEYFVYEANNLQNFFLHLFLVQEWGIVKSVWSYNAPSWSISVELLLYMSFFFLSLFFIKNIFQSFLSVLIVFILYIIIQPKLNNLSLGFVLFYVGGFTFFIFDLIKKKINENKNYIIYILLILNFIIFGRFLNQVFLDWQISLEHIIGNRVMILLFFVKFPLILINLSILQYYFKESGKRIKILGDVSYTIYLVHVPLQVIFSIVDKNIISINYDSNLIFILYFGFVIFFSIIIYKLFELPSKDYLRKKLIFSQTKN